MEGGTISIDRIQMPQWVMASVFGIMALAAAWGVYSSLSTGMTRSEFAPYQVDRDPAGFYLVVTGKFFVMLLCIAIVLHAAGLSATDPLAMMKQILPSLPNR
jgi:hypothetical protein